jgi:hypothetical protein
VYVVGGLYGNLPALDAIEAMAAAEAGPVTLFFNGEFNWFDVEPGQFEAVNRRVLTHHAIQGNVEAELGADDATAGCGCAYPEAVDNGTVERSNRIHARLRETAAAYPKLNAALSALPMYAVLRIGGQRVGIIHGDAESLAGWGFEHGALDDPQRRDWLARCFAEAAVDVFAASHTCLPALRSFEIDGRSCAVINNGAAGMPNFRGERSGVISRIALSPSPLRPLYGIRMGELFIDVPFVDQVETAARAGRQRRHAHYPVAGLELLLRRKLGPAEGDARRLGDTSALPLPFPRFERDEALRCRLRPDAPGCQAAGEGAVGGFVAQHQLKHAGGGIMGRGVRLEATRPIEG